MKYLKKKRVSMVNWQKLKIPTQHWLKYKCGWYIKVVTTTVVSLWNRIEWKRYFFLSTHFIHPFIHLPCVLVDSSSSHPSIHPVGGGAWFMRAAPRTHKSSIVEMGAVWRRVLASRDPRIVGHIRAHLERWWSTTRRIPTTACALTQKEEEKKKKRKKRF